MAEAAHQPLAVLIHGLGRTGASMRVLAWRLKRAGVACVCIRYPSTRVSIGASEAHVRRSLGAVGAQPLDLVGHSLGGLIAARILRDPQGLSIRRVVQLGSPNLGSPLIDRLGGLWPVRRICGPAVAELNGHARRVRPCARIAAIAGTGGWPGIPLPRPHDGGVTVRSAWSGAGHRAAVPVLHTALPISPGAARKVLEFLTTGRFEETPR